jgi:hypothetical protein
LENRKIKKGESIANCLLKRFGTLKVNKYIEYSLLALKNNNTLLEISKRFAKFAKNKFKFGI